MSSDRDLTIRIRGLSKAYTIQHGDQAQSTLAEQLLVWAKNPFRRIERETFYALREVDLDVYRGDVVGIIGRNGAGKSTLLKVLSRITTPTSGEVDLRGRVGSLLEVGTGFHPELTGRENVYLNGAVLGMTRGEIRKQFDAIVDFAGVERFLDTPVKRYSSGMYVRLAFAVAAHLRTEVLIVDEVLAVGDAEFQKKCLGRMQDAASGEGRTVLFVSHNMNAINTLCRRGVLLQGGSVVASGPIEQVVPLYFGAGAVAGEVDLAEHPNRTGGLTPHFAGVSIRRAGGGAETVFRVGDEVELVFGMAMPEAMRSPRLAVGITNSWGERVAAVASFLSPSEPGDLAADGAVTCGFRLPPLVPGRYYLDLSLEDSSGRFLDEVHAAACFEVAESGVLGSAYPYFREMGHVLIPSRWRTHDQPHPDSAGVV